MEEKPKCVFLRLTQVLEIFPISKSSWWQGCKEGRFPKPIKLGPRTTVWLKEDIENLARKFAAKSTQEEEKI